MLCSGIGPRRVRIVVSYVPRSPLTVRPFGRVDDMRGREACFLCLNAYVPLSFGSPSRERARRIECVAAGLGAGFLRTRRARVVQVAARAHHSLSHAGGHHVVRRLATRTSVSLEPRGASDDAWRFRAGCIVASGPQPLPEWSRKA